jgi:DNA helicase HerA-like ATPase
MNQQILSKDALLNIGKVISVKGRNVEVLVSKAKNSAILLYQGELIRNVSVGGYVKIGKGFNELVGKIDGEYTTEEKNYNSKSYKSERDKIRRILNISLIGYLEGRNFKQGVKELPLIDNECFLLNQGELDSVHNFIKTINGKADLKLRIGMLANDTGKSIEIGVNSLFASHIGIFGNTGSGKSYTLASLYHKLFAKFQNNKGFQSNAKFILIDFNGEYISETTKDNIITDAKYKGRYNLTTRKKAGNKYPITEAEISDDDFWAIFLTATEKTQKPFLKRALTNKFYFDRLNRKVDVRSAINNILDSLMTKKVDKGDIMQFLHELKLAFGEKIIIQDCIDNMQTYLQWHSGQQKFIYEGTTTLYQEKPAFVEKIRSLVQTIDPDVKGLSYLDKIRLRIIFQYYHELAKFDLNTEHIAPLVKRLKRIEDLDKVIEVSSNKSSKVLDIISLTNLNTEMKKILPLLICKQIYGLKKKERDPEKYLNIIIDEAHNILSHSSQRESETWKDYRLEMFEEIIKEGRKFGVFITIASQRPSDISDTIVSQLHNYFLHRLINNRDILAVERTISYLDKVSFEALPILPTGTCVFAGLSAHVPVVVEVDPIDTKFEPRNKTIKPTDYWN